MKKLILVASAVLGLAAPVLACPGHEDSKTADDKSAPATPKKSETSTTAKAAPATPAPAPTNKDQTKKPDKVSSR
jgi:hypothetical protein